MTSLVNRYFSKTPRNEQDLVQGLVTESVQIQGVTCFYLPRHLQNLDLIFGEDPISKFTSVLPIEMYIESSSAWDGQSELISKFGLEIRNKIRFSVSVPRWEQEVKKIKSSMLVSSRPQEGDLIYDSITKRLFEIKFIDQDNIFYQLGRMAYFYIIECEFFQYGSEEFKTGIKDIDDAAAAADTNLLDFFLYSEADVPLTDDNGTFIFLDIADHTNAATDTTPTFQEVAKIIEFSVDNPFGGN